MKTKILSLALVCVSSFLSAQSKNEFNDVSLLNKTYQDKDGFMIITTNDLTNKLENLQKYITHKADYRDFNVFVATESDWLGTSEAGKLALSRGAHASRARAHDILHYLKGKYEPLNLKYVIFIGDARPDIGTTPMLRMKHSNKGKNLLKYVTSGKGFSKHTTEEQEVIKKLVNDKGELTEYGTVISDYPYVDLDTDWDANNDGFLDATHDTDPNHTRLPEVYVGRIPYYGEDSEYGKASDVDIILNRIIDYDTEEDISWRYNYMLEYNDTKLRRKNFLDEHGINYEFISRFKSNVVGMPAIKGSNGEQHIPNIQQIQNFAVGVKGCHSHGGPTGMEGFSSKGIANTAHDNHPTVLTLGACDVGHIEGPDNLTYTLLRFQSVAVSGGTGSVTSYGNTSKKAEAEGKTKEDFLFQGKSVGEAHWDWYGVMYKDKSVIPMTGAKINIYGDPSVIPFKNGSKPTYPFIAQPVSGHFDVIKEGQDYEGKQIITVTNNQDAYTAITVSVSHPWLKVSDKRLALPKGKVKQIEVYVDKKEFAKQDYKPFYEAEVTLSSDNYSCRRRFVLKSVKEGLKYSFDFEKLDRKSFVNVLTDDPSLDDNFFINAKYFKFSGKGFKKTIKKAKLKAKKKGVAFDPSKFKKAINPFVQGYQGKGYDLEQYNISSKMKPFEKEDFAISFWAKSIGNAEGYLLKSGFLDVKVSDTKVEGTVKTYGLKGDKNIKTFDFSGNFSYKKDVWTHFVFTLDQDKGKFEVYANGEKIASTKVAKNQLYGGADFVFAPHNSVVDELLVYNKFADKELIESLNKGSYISAPYPKDNSLDVSNKSLELSFNHGIAVKTPKIYFYKSDDKKSKKQEVSLQDGRYVIPSLEADTKYSWYVASNGFKSKVWSFTTANEMLSSGNFEEGENLDWKGTTVSLGSEMSEDGGKNAFAINGNYDLKVDKSEPATTSIENALEKGRGFIFRGIAEGVAKKSGLSITAYYKENGSKIPVGSYNSVIKKGRKHEFALKFVSPNKELTDNTLFLEVKNTIASKGKPNVISFDDMSLVNFKAEGRNFGPTVVKDLTQLKAVAEVGQIGYHINLNDLVKDPEGSFLRYSIISGPTWAFIQENDLFSAYGPDKENVGVNTFVISATDDKGESTTFTIPVKVKN